MTPLPEQDDDALTDGEHFGLIGDVDLDAGTLDFDLAQWLVNPQASRAAVEDGVIGPDSDCNIENDYYIRNASEQERTLALADDVDLEVVDWEDCCESTEGDLQAFADAFDDPDAAALGAYRGPHSLYWLTSQDGEIVSIREQFVP